MPTYEEENWDTLSPKFRDAHNRLRQARGQPTIPPPAVDRYVAPQKRTVTLADPNDPEVVQEIRQHAAQLFGQGGMRFGIGDEGFRDQQQARRQAEPDEGWR